MWLKSAAAQAGALTFHCMNTACVGSGNVFAHTFTYMQMDHANRP